MSEHSSRRLAEVSPRLERVLTHGTIDVPRRHSAGEIHCRTTMVRMRDGVQLATDIYLPPVLPAPVIALRTPYGRASDKLIGVFYAFARRGYAVVSQDCRGTGDSEPASWDYYVYESEDSVDLVDWIVQQEWFDGFLGSCGGSYVGQTQWCMAMHPRMSTIVPEVSGLGVAINTAHLHMFANAYARTVGKGANKLSVPTTEMERAIESETMGSGYFNDPLHAPFSKSLRARYPTVAQLPFLEAQHWLWREYCAMTSAQRAELVKLAFETDQVTLVEVESLSTLFGRHISHDAHTVPNVDSAQLAQRLQAPPLMITGWYDWGLNDALATWQLLRREAGASIRSRARLVIAPSAHNMPGYHEATAGHPELNHNHRTENNVALLLSWYASVRDATAEAWPTVIYYLMGANEWRVAQDWPPPETSAMQLYLNEGQALTAEPPLQPARADTYTFNPDDPTPTVGGSILSYVYPPGSVDVSDVQRRNDMLVYTTAELTSDLDVVGPLRMVLYASSSAVDTDFCARLSDVGPDGRAIQLQSGIMRARYRDPRNPRLLEPDRIYRFDIDLWATAHRFKAGHRLRVDISSADFPRFDRNANRGGEPGPAVKAMQSIHRDSQHPSHLVISVLRT